MSVLLTVAFVQMLAVVSPGPSFLITARMAVARSRLDGIKVAAGLAAGTVVWSSAAVLGLHAVFVQVPWLYLTMKIAGALFLMYIAVQIVRHAKAPLELTVDGAAGSPFVTGFLTQLTNPKVVVFFGSIFISILPADVPLWLSLSLIAMVSFNELWWYSAVSVFFSLPPVRNAYIKAKTAIDVVVGVFLGGLGLKLIWDALAG